jgi:hypothetical protein
MDTDLMMNACRSAFPTRSLLFLVDVEPTNSETSGEVVSQPVMKPMG